MPWNQKDGGGWQGGNRGPWGQGSGGGRNNGSGGGQPPDLEELLKRGGDRMRNVMPGGIGRGGVIAIILGLALLWLASGLYIVPAESQGVVTRFGAYRETTQPGWHWHMPIPIESSTILPVERSNQLNIGFIRSGPQGNETDRDVSQESRMLTGDENIIEIDFTVLWKIQNPTDFLFNIQNPVGTIKAVSESAMREIVGQSRAADVQTENRTEIQQAVRDLVQKTLDEYGAGIDVLNVELQAARPPEQVIEAFRDIQRAKADAEKAKNEADAYRNKVLPEAGGQAAKIVEQANAYKERVTAEAEGEAQRFVAVYDEYKVAKNVTRQRIFIETMERVLAEMNKVIVDDAGGGVVPYLPLPELQKRSSGQGG